MAKYSMAFSQAFELEPDEDTSNSNLASDPMADSAHTKAVANEVEAQAAQPLAAAQNSDEAEGIIELAAWLQRKVTPS